MAALTASGPRLASGRMLVFHAGNTWLADGGKEGKPDLEPDLTGPPTTALLLVRGYVAGTGFEPV